jgi:hypothetical protein
VFYYRRGVRQGDPLSPLLFVLAVDLLQSIVNKAKDEGLLRLPVYVGYTNDFRIIQYAYDTLLIMEACPRQLIALKAIINTFADSTSLKVNYAKSSMIPINLSSDRLHHLASTFDCQTRSFPFTYLGLPLTYGKHIVQDCLPLANRVKRRLVGTSTWLTQGGKLQLVNSLFSSLPTFYMCAIKVPIDILNQIDKYMRHCLWLGGDVNAKKTSIGSMEDGDHVKIKMRDMCFDIKIAK